MDTDVKTEGDDRRLNNLVAITVVFLTVFMAVSKTKDDKPWIMEKAIIGRTMIRGFACPAPASRDGISPALGGG